MFVEEGLLSRICAQGMRVESARVKQTTGVPKHCLRALGFLEETDDWNCINIDAPVELECVWLVIVPWQCSLSLTCLVQQGRAELAELSSLPFFLLSLALEGPQSPKLANGSDALPGLLQHGNRFSLPTPYP